MSVESRTYIEPSGASIRRGKAVLRSLSIYAVMIAISLLLLAPLFWMVSTALKDRKQIFTYPPEWTPSPALWHNFGDSLSAYPFGRFAANTLIIAGFNIAGVLVTASLAAYAFARLRFPGRDLIFMILL